jgi:hypothetical protein
MFGRVVGIVITIGLIIGSGFMVKFGSDGNQDSGATLYITVGSLESNGIQTSQCTSIKIADGSDFMNEYQCIVTIIYLDVYNQSHTVIETRQYIQEPPTTQQVKVEYSSAVKAVSDSNAMTTRQITLLVVGMLGIIFCTALT